MEHYESSDQSQAEMCPLRPTQEAAGTAHTSASVIAITVTDPEGKVHTVSEGMDGVSVTQTGSVALSEVSLAELEEKYNQAIKSSSELENQNSELTSKVDKLQESLQQMSELFCEKYNELTGLRKKYDTQLELNNHIHSEYESKEEKYKEKITMLKVSCAEAQREYNEATESKAQLEKEISDLKSSVMELDNELTQSRKKCNELMSVHESLRNDYTGLKSVHEQTLKEHDELLKEYSREQEAHNTLKLQHNELKETSQVSLTEVKEKYNQAIKSSAELENQNLELTSRVDRLQESVQQRNELFCEKYNELTDLRKMYDTQLELNNHIHSEYESKEEKYEEKITMLKVSLSEAETECNEATESKAQLEKEISDLKSSVMELDNELSQSRTKCNELMSVHESLRNDYTGLKSAHEQTLKEHDELLKEYSQEQEAHNTLKLQHNELKETSQVSLAELDLKYNQAIKSSAHLENQNRELKSKADKLQESVQQMSELFCEKYNSLTGLRKKYDTEQELNNYIQCEYESKEEKYKEKIKMLKVSLAEAQTECNEATESKAQLEREISDLKSSVMELDNELSQSRTKCNELMRECEVKNNDLSILQSEHKEMKEMLLKECRQEPEIHLMLQSQNEILKQLLSQKEEFLKHSLAEAEWKHEQTKKDKAKLQNENTNLMSQIDKLQDTVEQLQNMLLKAQKEVEAQSAQKSENNDMVETVQQHNELPQVYMDEAGRSSEQPNNSSNSQENEIMILRSKVSKLQDTTEVLSRVLSETQKKYSTSKTNCSVVKGILNFVKTSNRKRVNNLIKKQSSLKTHLEETEIEYDDALERIEELESRVTQYVADLHDRDERVNELEGELSEVRIRCDIAVRESERKEEELTNQRFKWNLFNEDFLKDYEIACTARDNLDAQNKEIKEKYEQLVLSSQDASKYEQLKLLNTHLEEENSKLRYQMHKLRGSVQQLEEEHLELDKTCQVIKEDHEHTNEAYRNLLLLYDDVVNHRDRLIQELEELKEANCREQE